MATAVTYQGDVTRQAQDQSTTSLFAGQKLWFSHSVPQRKRFIQDARANGAVVTEIDVQADIVLFDHAKKNAPPGSYSYRYIEQSIRNGTRENLDDHLIATDSRVNRPVGSVKTASKAGRNPFTEADDQLLWNWVKPYMDAGGQWKGNQIYKQLEQHNSRHTFQSWRDRWIKHTQSQNRAITAEIGPYQVDDLEVERAVTRTPKRRKIINQDPGSSTLGEQVAGIHPADDAMGNEMSVEGTAPEISPPVEQQAGTASNTNDLPVTHNFTQEDARLLYQAAPNILNTNPIKLDTAWGNVAREHPHHSKDAWRAYFQDVIVPEYRRRHGLLTEESLEQHVNEKALEDQDEQSDRLSTSTTDSDNSDDATTDDEVDLHEDEDEDQEIEEKVEGELNKDIETEIVSASVEEISKPKRNADRPPEPNEARKRSQCRGVDFDQNSQSRSSQSQQKSQQTQNSSTGSLSDIPFRAEIHQTEPSEKVMLQPNTIKLPITPRKERNISDFQSVGHVSTRQHAPGATFASQDEERFVTQHTDSKTSQTEGDGIEDSSTDSLQARAELPQNLGHSPLFYSESSDDSEGEDYGALWQHTENNTEIDKIVHDEQTFSGAGKLSSQYAPSQVPLEAVKFEDESTLSAAWETAPSEQRHDLRLEEIESNTSIRLDAEQVSPDIRYESTPLAAKRKRTTLSTDQTGLDLLPAQKFQKRQSTQALLAESVEQDFHDAMFAIPPPFGGWDDDHDLGVDEEHRIHTKQDGSEHLIRKKTAVSPPANKKISESKVPEGEVGTWLAIQTSKYPGIDLTVLDEICLKSLEATSLKQDLASEIVSSLVSTFQKGKHPAMNQLDSILDLKREHQNLQGRGNHKSRRKSKSFRQAIARMVDSMMPINHQGVWTKEDDRKLTGTNARSVEEVERKHGEEGVRSRFEYLEQLYRE